MKSSAALCLPGARALLRAQPSPKDNQLTRAEKKAGWKLLFRRGIAQGLAQLCENPTAPSKAGWWENGILKCVANAHGGRHRQHGAIHRLRPAMGLDDPR